MSRENVEVVREQFEATNRRDFARPMASWADDIELVAIAGTLAGTYSGREAVGEFFGDWFRTFGGGVHFDVQEIRDVGDAVVVAVHHRARGRHSGVELTDDLFYEYRLSEGKIVRVEFHPTWSDALEAVGLRE
jgi:ketosteroid isomerase-like protein